TPRALPPPTVAIVTDRTAHLLAAHHRRATDRVVRLVDDLSAAQLAWRPAPGGDSSGHHLSHLARRPDELASRRPRITPRRHRRRRAAGPPDPPEPPPGRDRLPARAAGPARRHHALIPRRLNRCRPFVPTMA